MNDNDVWVFIINWIKMKCYHSISDMCGCLNEIYIMKVIIGWHKAPAASEDNIDKCHIYSFVSNDFI